MPAGQFERKAAFIAKNRLGNELRFGDER